MRFIPGATLLVSLLATTALAAPMASCKTNTLAEPNGWIDSEGRPDPSRIASSMVDGEPTMDSIVLRYATAPWYRILAMITDGARPEWRGWAANDGGYEGVDRNPFGPARISCLPVPWRATTATLHHSPGGSSANMRVTGFPLAGSASDTFRIEPDSTTYEPSPAGGIEATFDLQRFIDTHTQIWFSSTGDWPDTRTQAERRYLRFGSIAEPAALTMWLSVTWFLHHRRERYPA